MKNAFGHIPEDVLNYVQSQDEVKRRRQERARKQAAERNRQLAERDRVRREREAARKARPKKTWGNFLK